MVARRGINLRTKLILFLTFFLLVPIFLFGLISHEKSVEHIERYKALEYSRLLNQLDSSLVSWHRNTLNLATLVAELPQAKIDSQIDISMAMRKFLQRFPRFRRFRFFDLHGSRVVEEPLPLSAVPEHFSELIRQVIINEKPKYSEIYKEPQIGDSIFTIFIPSYDEKGSIAYVLAADLNLSLLDNTILSISPRDSLHFSLLDVHGHLMAGSNIPFASSALASGEGKFVSDKHRDMVVVSDSQNQRFVTLSRMNTDTNWLIVIFEEEGKTFAELHRSNRSIATLVIISSILTVLAGFFFAGRMTQSIDILARATRDIAKQNYDIEVDIHTNDEVEDLAKSFLYMAKEVKKSQLEIENFNRELENMVTVRTTALSESQKTLSALLSGMNDDVLMIDTEGIIRYCNRPYTERFGDHTDQPGGTAYQVKNGNFGDLLSLVRTSGNKEHRTLTMIVPGGEYHVDVLVTPLTDLESGKNGCVAVIRDITQKVTQEKAVLELKNYYHAIFSSLREGLITTDRENIITGFNPAAMEILRKKEEELEYIDLGLVFRQLNLSPHPIDELVPDFDKQIQCECIHKKDDHTHILVSAVPLQSDRLLWVLTDVSNFKELEAQLIQSDKLASLGQLMAGMAHEINNPLTGILGFSSMLKARENDEFKQKTLDRIINSSHRINNIIVNMRQFASPSKRVMSLTSINELLNQSLELLENEIAKYQVKITLEKGDVADCYMDANQIQQVITNVVINALHAIQLAKCDGRIHILTTTENNEVVLRISDNGIGIPEKDRNRLFDPFFTTKADWKGTGLGLSICYTIIQNHDGNIQLISRENKGTTVTINLPLDENVESRMPKVSLDDMREYSVLQNEDELPERVLIVEDEEYIRTMFNAFPERFSQTVASGKLALEILKKENFDLLIVDLRLPDMTGNELIKQIKKENDKIRFMVITGCAEDDELVTDIRQSEDIKIVFKPFTIQDIIWELEHWS